MSQEPLPSAFVWRGITLDRVVHRERAGGSVYGFDLGQGSRMIETPSKPPVFSGAVGIWRYTLEMQADSSWVGKIYIGSASNVNVEPSRDFVAALDFAAEWWAVAVKALPEAPAE